MECWQERERFPDCVRENGSLRSGRECCRRVDPEFRAMEDELHNLVPSVGELNADRSNLPYWEVAGEPRAYGSCDFEVSGGLVEPSAIVQGDLERIYLAMDAWYGIGLTSEQRHAVAQRMKLAEGFTRRLQTLGLQRREKPVPSLQEYLAARDSTEPDATA